MMNKISNNQDQGEQIEIAQACIRREVSQAVRLVKDILVDGKRWRGIPKKWLGYVMACDLKNVGVKEEEVGDIVQWRYRNKVVDKLLREKAKLKKRRKRHHRYYI